MTAILLAIHTHTHTHMLLAYTDDGVACTLAQHVYRADDVCSVCNVMCVVFRFVGECETTRVPSSPINACERYTHLLCVCVSVFQIVFSTYAFYM